MSQEAARSLGVLVSVDTTKRWHGSRKSTVHCDLTSARFGLFKRSTTENNVSALTDKHKRFSRLSLETT
jgi:hypothetical protein